jgi:hypothetical protein
VKAGYSKQLIINATTFHTQMGCQRRNCGSEFKMPQAQRLFF